MNKETFEAAMLIAYHSYQVRDLQQDVDGGLVKQRIVEDWQEGYRTTVFGIRVTKQVATLSSQWNAYQEAMAFHTRRISELRAAYPDTLQYRARIGFENGELCTKFLFGTEPTVLDLLAYLHTEKLVEIPF